MKQLFHTTAQGTILAISAIRQSSEALMNILDNKHLYCPRVQSMSSEHRKREWLSVRVLLKNILREEKEILYTPHGKPYFADHSYHLSISHTKTYVAVALNKTHPVGIDIEYISPRINKISGRFINNDENKHISPANGEIHLLLHWSAKESLYKILGMEDVDFKECLHVLPFRPVLHEWSSFSAYETKTERRQQYVVHYLVDDEYVATIAEES
jgi:phosphopantetheinyl transferase